MHEKINKKILIIIYYIIFLLCLLNIIINNSKLHTNKLRAKVMESVVKVNSPQNKKDDQFYFRIIPKKITEKNNKNVNINNLSKEKVQMHPVALQRTKEGVQKKWMEHMEKKFTYRLNLLNKKCLRFKKYKPPDTTSFTKDNRILYSKKYDLLTCINSKVKSKFRNLIDTS